LIDDDAAALGTIQNALLVISNFTGLDDGNAAFGSSADDGNIVGDWKSLPASTKQLQAGSVGNQRYMNFLALKLNFALPITWSMRSSYGNLL
jgi:hypothetical protein